MTSALLASYRSWLISRSYSPTTIRNYLADVNKYLASIDSTKEALSTNNLFAQSFLSSYLNQLSPKNYASRALASLSKFCQFALDQKIISTNPLKNIVNLPPANSSFSTTTNIESLILEFKNNLIKHHKSTNTVTNYINDIKQFILYSSKN